MVNEDEAARVRAIFELYLEHESLHRHGPGAGRAGLDHQAVDHQEGPRWPAGARSTSTASTTCSPTSSTSAGSPTRTRSTTASTRPSSTRRSSAAPSSSCSATGRPAAGTSGTSYGALLKGLLRCVPCGCAMVPTHTVKNGNAAVPLLRLHERPEARLAHLPVEVDPGRGDRAVRRRPDPLHRQGPGPPGRDARGDAGPGQGAHQGPGGREARPGAGPRPAQRRAAEAGGPHGHERDRHGPPGRPAGPDPGRRAAEPPRSARS